MEFSTAIYNRCSDISFRMQGQQGSNREIRRKIAEYCAEFPKTAGLQMMRFDRGKDYYFPVVYASAIGGFLQTKSENRCVLGVSRTGQGSAVGGGFADMLIGYSDFNEMTIEKVLRRALQGDPMSFDEWTAQKSQSGPGIVNYGNDNVIGGGDVTQW
ncbi:hypothetical protein [Demequina sp. NBRC 110054]|uniref:hypothetical protein n=1 Tax=Demequina sp. NBRC 110054 TaxID=1570343 RepID=UPI000A00FE56|nr:hypothetical protein [Demequina sp. NBRC 110054]